MSTNPAAFARAEQRFFEATPKSRALFAEAKEVLPGGIGRVGIPYTHYPVFIKRAEAQYLYDVDGRRIVDFWNGASSLPLGHSHPHVMAAMRKQMEDGLGFGSPVEAEIRLSQMIRERIPSMERMRYTASGTEATMFAVRLARAFTGRQLMGRMIKSYHGMHDMMMSGQGATLGGTWLGLNDNPVGAGVLPHVREGVVFLPFNDLEGCRRVVEERASEMATIIVEPFMGSGGGIPPEDGFLQGLRELCDRHDILLIFDEMISIGMSRGGAQGYYGVRPDLTASGKMLNAGMPGGVFGGRADIMALLDPGDGGPRVMHTGTWNGHPLVMVAGIAQLEALTDETFRYLGHIGDLYRTSVRSLAKKMRLAVQVTGAQHFSAIHYTDRPVRSPDDAFGDPALHTRVHFSLLSQGFNVFGGGRTNLSAALTEQNVADYIGALEIAWEEAGVTEAARLAL